MSSGSISPRDGTFRPIEDLVSEDEADANQSWTQVDETTLISQPTVDGTQYVLKKLPNPCDAIRHLFVEVLPTIPHTVTFYSEQEHPTDHDHSYFHFVKPSCLTLEEQFRLTGLRDQESGKYTQGATIKVVRWIFWHLLQTLKGFEEHKLIHGNIDSSTIYYDPTSFEVRLDPPDQAITSPSSLQTNPLLASPFTAPEVLLGKPSYDTSIDLWSTTVAMVEVYLNEPLFRIDQTNSPDYETILFLLTYQCKMPSAAFLNEAAGLQFFSLRSGRLFLTSKPPIDVSQTHPSFFGPSISAKGRDTDETETAYYFQQLVQSILVYEERPTLAEVMEHPFFQEEPDA